MAESERVAMDMPGDHPVSGELATQSVPAVERAFAILDLLANSRIGLTLGEIVKLSGLPKSSTHCILLTLQRLGHLHRNETTSRYMFGRKFFQLADNALIGTRLRDQATPVLVSLMQQTQLAVHMAILERNEAVLISKIEYPGGARLATWIGKRMEVHCTSLGKALSAWLPESELARLLKDRGLPRHNENTIATSGKLKEDLEKTRKRGYSVDDEEDELGWRCIGAPVFDQAGAPVAAISVAGPTEQVSADNVEQLARAVRNAAATISQLLV